LFQKYVRVLDSRFRFLRLFIRLGTYLCIPSHFNASVELFFVIVSGLRNLCSNYQILKLIESSTIVSCLYVSPAILGMRLVINTVLNDCYLLVYPFWIVILDALGMKLTSWRADRRFLIHCFVGCIRIITLFSSVAYLCMLTCLLWKVTIFLTDRAGTILLLDLTDQMHTKFYDRRVWNWNERRFEDCCLVFAEF